MKVALDSVALNITESIPSVVGVTPLNYVVHFDSKLLTAMCELELPDGSVMRKNFIVWAGEDFTANVRDNIDFNAVNKRLFAVFGVDSNVADTALAAAVQDIANP